MLISIINDRTLSFSSCIHKGGKADVEWATPHPTRSPWGLSSNWKSATTQTPGVRRRDRLELR